MTQVSTIQGDTVDLVAKRHFGRTGGITEQLLRCNPGLSAQGPILPIGTDITLPVAPVEESEQQQINLWD